MKYEVKPMTMTALIHCMTRVASCNGRAIAVEKIIVKEYGKYTKRRGGFVRDEAVELHAYEIIDE